MRKRLLLIVTGAFLFAGAEGRACAENYTVTLLPYQPGYGPTALALNNAGQLAEAYWTVPGGPMPSGTGLLVLNTNGKLSGPFQN